MASGYCYAIRWAEDVGRIEPWPIVAMLLVMFKSWLGDGFMVFITSLKINS